MTEILIPVFARGYSAFHADSSSDGSHADSSSDGSITRLVAKQVAFIISFIVLMSAAYMIIGGR